MAANVIDEVERTDSDVRKRAAWLLALLAVVAGLLVLLMVTLLHGGGGGPKNAVANIDAPTNDAGTTPNSAQQNSTGTSPVVGSSTGDEPGSSPDSTAGSRGRSVRIPPPSCPGTKTCAVTGNIAAAKAAINAYRADHNEKPVDATTSREASTCAVTSGDDCPASYVWVHVDGLGGQAVVDGVNGYQNSDDLLSNGAKAFEIGWAYDPGAKTVYCAVLRVD